VSSLFIDRSRRGRDRKVVGVTSTYAISAYDHWYCEFESDQGEVYNIMRSNLSVTCDRLVVSSGSSVSSSNKTDHNDITEILLKVALSTIKQTVFTNTTFLIFKPLKLSDR
jgi:hypothetical protein